MTGPEHYRTAEKLLALTESPDASPETHLFVGRILAAAQVHATLALAAATAYPALTDYDGAVDTATAWAGVA